jgi:hypothetical protein
MIARHQAIAVDAFTLDELRGTLPTKTKTTATTEPKKQTPPLAIA